MEASIREKRLLLFESEMKNKWVRELYIKVGAHKAIKVIGWWKMGIW
jgi:hypothetical protein